MCLETNVLNMDVLDNYHNVSAIILSRVMVTDLEGTWMQAIYFQKYKWDVKDFQMFGCKEWIVKMWTRLIIFLKSLISSPASFIFQPGRHSSYFGTHTFHEYQLYQADLCPISSLFYNLDVHFVLAVHHSLHGTWDFHYEQWKWRECTHVYMYPICIDEKMVELLVAKVQLHCSCFFKTYPVVISVGFFNLPEYCIGSSFLRTHESSLWG